MQVSTARVDVLNSSFEQLGHTKLARAIALILRGDAYVEEEDPHRLVRYENGVYPWPLVIRLATYRKVPYRIAPAGWSKVGVLKRDDYICAYCGKKNATTVDHILPRAQGGKNTWENTVASCLYDNGVKDNRTPEEAEMPLLFQPTVPMKEYFTTKK